MISQDTARMYLTLQNITLIVAIYVPATKVLVSGLPVKQHKILKKLAFKQGTSVNKLILAAIKESIT